LAGAALNLYPMAEGICHDALSSRASTFGRGSFLFIVAKLREPARSSEGPMCKSIIPLLAQGSGVGVSLAVAQRGVWPFETTICLERARCYRTGLAIGVGQMAITITVWKFMFRKHSLRMAALMLCAVSASAAAMDRGQFQNVPPAIREWFENMRSPKGISCCSYADGHRTGYDIRQGQYWVPIDGDWYPVPPEAVIKTENPVGEAIV
jgi:hypothetical protein